MCNKLRARLAQLEWQLEDLKQSQAAQERHRLGLSPEGNQVTEALVELHRAFLQVAEAMHLAPPAPEVPAVLSFQAQPDMQAALQLGLQLANLNRSSKRAARARAAR